MIDVVRQIAAVHRAVGEGRIAAGPGRTIRLQRDYDASIDDVWDALTNPERVSRWFLPISGDFRLGGRYQLEGNAGGEIVACEKPNRLKVTWVYGDPQSEADVSELELRLSSADAGKTSVTLEHTAIVPDEMWSEYGPGAVGVGWDQGMLGLSLHLTGGSVGDPTAWQLSEEGRDFATRSSEAWGEANTAAGADAETAARGVANTVTFYTQDPGAAS